MFLPFPISPYSINSIFLPIPLIPFSSKPSLSMTLHHQCWMDWRVLGWKNEEGNLRIQLGIAVVWFHSKEQQSWRFWGREKQSPKSREVSRRIVGMAL